ncbi:MAG: hypothetical protein WCJ35_25225 [Planctomycetota bacterium]
MQGLIGSLACLFFVVSFLSISGCSKDPLAEFKAAAAKVDASLPDVLGHKSKLVREGSKPWEPLTINVEKSQSLMTPYTATMTCAYATPNNDGSICMNCKLLVDYEYRENHWMCKRLRKMTGQPIYVSGSKSRYEQIVSGWSPVVMLDVSDAEMVNADDPGLILFRDCVAATSDQAKK